MKKNKYTPEEIHDRLLSIAKEFHKICMKNNIRYYMIGGTFLGAVRHKGFIPWDDDMDFGIPRKDYDKLIGLAPSINSGDYELRFYMTEGNSPIHYIKFIDKTTTLIEKEYHNYIEGLYIDIFPLDRDNNSYIIDIINRKIIHLYHTLIILHCSTRKRRGIKRIIQRISQFLNLKHLHKSLEKRMIKNRDKQTKYIANYLGAWGDKEVHPLNEFAKPILYEFEDTAFWGPYKADDYLKRLYGNYLLLPPIEKRVFRHEYYYLDLDCPYRKYIENQSKKGV